MTLLYCTCNKLILISLVDFVVHPPPPFFLPPFLYAFEDRPVVDELHSGLHAVIFGRVRQVYFFIFPTPVSMHSSSSWKFCACFAHQARRRESRERWGASGLEGCQRVSTAETSVSEGIPQSVAMIKYKKNFSYLYLCY